MKTKLIRFHRFGRSYHLAVKTAKDLKHVLTLDKAHWVATGAPTTSNFDPVFLDLIDTDNNKRVMCFEIRDAIDWLLNILQNHASIIDGSTILTLDDIDKNNPDGECIFEAATKIVSQAETANAQSITLEQAREIKKKIESTPVSEAGVVLPEAFKDTDIRQFAQDIIDTLGGVPHPDGKNGVNKEKLETFIEQGRAYLEWHTQGATTKDNATSDIMPMGDKTAEAYKIYIQLRAKINQYFAQCKSVSFDPRIEDHIQPNTARLEAVNFNEPTAINAVLRDMPLAHPNKDRLLHLDGLLNLSYTGPDRPTHNAGYSTDTPFKLQNIDRRSIANR